MTSPRFRIGRYPAQLEDLVPKYFEVLPLDRGSDQSFHYHLAESGLPKLYGTGPDGRDEGARSGSDDVWWYFPPHDVAAERHPSPD